MRVIKTILARMWRDWEKTLCRLLGLALALCILQWGWGIFGEEEAGTTTKGATPMQKPLLNLASAFAFRTPPPEYTDKAHAFQANIARTADRPNRAWSRPAFTGGAKPEPPKPEPPKPEPPKPTPPTPTPPPPAAPPKPPPPKRTQTVEYRGCMTSASGKQLALVQDVASKKVAYVQKGEKLGDLTVGGFTAQALTVLDGKGQESAVDFGKQKKILLE